MAKRKNNTGWIRQIGSGRWQAKFRTPDGQMHKAPQTFDTRLDGEAWLAHQQRRLDAGTWQPADGTGHGTFGTYAETWLIERPLKPTSRAEYRRLLDAHILPTFRDTPLDVIDVATVKAWHRALGREHAEHPTLMARAYGLLRTILNTAWQDDLIKSNPARIRGAGNVRRASRTDLPTPEQVHALADSMAVGYPTHDKYRTMVLIAAWCGLRFGELVELRRKDLAGAPEPHTIKVRRAVVRVDGEHIVQSPKSEAGQRDVAIPPHIRRDLADYLDTVPADPEALVFPASRSGGHITPGALNKVWYRARAEVGLPNLRWHDLRHFSATSAAQTGATTAELMARLGHSTTQAAFRYQHAASDADARIAASMSNVISMPPTRQPSNRRKRNGTRQGA